MDAAKLKALKVPDLKAILQKANIPIGSKSNKQDLIAKITASPAALDAYNQLHQQPSSSLSPPLSQQQPAHPPPAPSPNDAPLPTTQPSHPRPPQQQQPVSSDNLAPPVVTTQKPPLNNGTSAPYTSETVSQPSNGITTTAPEAETVDDPDSLEQKLKRRAERFGIPLVEQPQPAAAKSESSILARAAAVGEDPEKLKARAARFGPIEPPEQLENNKKLNSREARSNRVAPPPPPSNGAAEPADLNKRKRTIVEEPADAAEFERRKKRLERFGTGSTLPEAPKVQA